MYVQSIKPNGMPAVTLSALTQPESLLCDRCAGRSPGLCAPLCDKSHATLVAMGGRRHWAKRQELYCGGDLARAFYKITKGVVAEIMDLVRQLDTINRFRFRDDAESLAAWRSARNVAWPVGDKTREPDKGVQPAA